MQEVHAVATYEDMLRLLAQRLESMRDAEDAYLSAADGSAEEARARNAYRRAIDKYLVINDAIIQLYGVSARDAKADAEVLLAAWEADGGDGDA